MRVGDDCISSLFDSFFRLSFLPDLLLCVPALCLVKECALPFYSISRLTLIPLGYEFHFVSFLEFHCATIIIIKASSDFLVQGCGI